MKIETIKISEIKPYKNNPRKNDQAVKVVKRSIKEFGFRNPILIDKNNEIIAGHTRLKAAIELEYKEVPCMKIEDLTKEQVKAFRIMDNKSSENAQWDNDLLKEEFTEIDEAEYDLELTGFELREVGDILDEGVEVEEDIVAVDAYERAKNKTKIKQGEIYQLGEHRLMCGDSTEKSNVDKLMGENKADMVFTDPPHLKSLDKNSWISAKYGTLDPETWREDILKGFNECWRVLDDNGVLIFKWSTSHDVRPKRDISVSEILKLLPVKPIFGHPSGSKLNTIWMTFMKIPEENK